MSLKRVSARARNELRAHKRELLSISEKIAHIADKELAHATIAGPNPNMRPTFAELFHCIEQFESIAVRYTAYLTGQPLLVRDDGSIMQVRLGGSSSRQP